MMFRLFRAFPKSSNWLVDTVNSRLRTLRLLAGMVVLLAGFWTYVLSTTDEVELLNWRVGAATLCAVIGEGVALTMLMRLAHLEHKGGELLSVLKAKQRLLAWIFPAAALALLGVMLTGLLALGGRMVFMSW